MQVHKSLMATNAGYQEQVTTEESAQADTPANDDINHPKEIAGNKDFAS